MDSTVPATTPASDLEGSINQRYDATMYDPMTYEFNQGSDYTNYGFWGHGAENAKEAGDALVETLLSFLPRKTGRILDVACGKGETTRYLTRYFPASAVTGINISERQLATCRANVPGAAFLRMDAAKLDFDDAVFDVVISVEAAFHFNTRQRFFSEAFRVLRPGGHLVLSDILVTPEVLNYHGRTVPENFVDGLAHYREILSAVGFSSLAVVDATQECWHGHFRRAVMFGHDQLLQGRLTTAELQRRLAVYYQRLEYTSAYLMVSAQKP